MQTAKGAESWNSHPGRMPGSLNIPSTANTAARSPVVVISIVFLLFFMDIPPWALRAVSKFSLYGMAAPTSYAHIRRHPGKINGSGAGSPQAPLYAATLRRHFTPPLFGAPVNPYAWQQNPVPGRILPQRHRHPLRKIASAAPTWADIFPTATL